MYQNQLAPVPNRPPTTFNVVDAPEHIVDGVTVAEVHITEFVFTVTVLETHSVVLHVPSARK